METIVCAAKFKNVKVGGTPIENIIRSLCGTILLLLCLKGVSGAYTVVTVSTGTPNTVEQVLLAQIANQFNATIHTNPLAANTYTVKLFGLNSTYLPPVPSTGLVTLDTLANKLTAIADNTVPTLYGMGMLYERNRDAGTLGYFMGLCGNATNFYNAPSDSMTWTTRIDSTTCRNVLGFMDNWIVSQTSGIAVVPNPALGF